MKTLLHGAESATILGPFTRGWISEGRNYRANEKINYYMRNLSYFLPTEAKKREMSGRVLQRMIRNQWR